MINTFIPLSLQVNYALRNKFKVMSFTPRKQENSPNLTKDT